MSEPSISHYYCEKCGAPVDPTDKKCPNGHDLKEVGKKHILSIENGIFLSDKVSIVHSASEAVIIKLTEYKELFATLTVKQKDEYFDEINKNLEIVIDQTRPKSWTEKIKDKIIDNLLSYVILLLIGYLVAILFS